MPTNRRQQAQARLGAVELGSYRLVELIAAGSFATAYLAEHTGTGRKTVVKIAHADLFIGPRANELRARFDAEARAAARVRHPCLVRIHDAGTTGDGVPAIAMDYVPGPSLATVLTRRRAVDFDLVDRCVRGLGDTLRVLHDAGVVHRDVTPRNVVWTTSSGDGSGNPVLLDFGVAKLDNRSLGTIGAMGTPGYMPPEQLFGRAVPRSDVYALGAILWWACTGRSFLSHFADVEDLLAYQMGDRGPLDPNLENATIPSELADLLVWMLEPDPEARPTAAQLLDVWQSLVASLRGNWNPPTALQVGERAVSEDDVPVSIDATTQGAGPQYAAGVDVCVAIDDAPLLRLVTAFLRGEGHTVEVSTAPSAARSDGRTAPRLFVLGDELHGIDVAEVAAELHAEAPGCRVIVVGRTVVAIDAPVDGTFRLPAQLHAFADHVHDALRDDLASGYDSPKTWMPLPLNRDTLARLAESSDATQITSGIDAFLVDFPTWASALDVAVASTDDSAVRRTCMQISQAASTLGADRLADLAQVVHAVAPDDRVFVQRILGDLRAEFGRVQRALQLTRAQFHR